MGKLDDRSETSVGEALIRRLARTPGVMPFTGTERYRVCGCLGEGGFGVVYEVEDRQLGRRMALKTLKPQRAGFAANIRRLKSEFRSVADLVHPNLIGLHELAFEDGRWFFTMELVRGYDFLEYVSGETALAYTRTGQEPDARPPARRRDSSGILSEVRLRACLRQLAAGVSALHAAGIIHRDLKPSNVLVEPDGRVVILDFGLAGAGSAVDADASLRFAGTPAYMAPEQADDVTVTPAADWYAVGVMLYEALSGQLPFDDETGPKLAEKWTRDPVPPSRHRRVPADLERLCLALLHRKPEERPDAAAIVAVIDQGRATPSHDSRRRDEHSAFVGRSRELEVLRTAHASVLAGQPRVVRIQGDPGVGKSTLLRRFLDELPSETLVLAGRCHEREWVPFKAFDGVVDALVRYLRTLPRNEASGLLPRDIHLVAQLFPTFEAVAAVRDIPRRQASPIDPSETRLRAFAALKELTARLADKRPLVIAIDDLQWGDVDSSRLMAQLIAPPDRPTLLLLLAHRRDEHAPTLGETLRVLEAAAEGGAGIELGPLPSDDAERFAARLLRAANRGAEAARTIAQRAEGHPLFMEELARALLGDAADGAAPTLMDIFWQRVGRLSDGARALLETVAVAGQPTAPNTCFEAAGLGGAGVDAVRILRAERLVVTADTGAINVFHDRIREAVIAHLGLGAKRTRHLALARSLEQRPEPDLEDLARHYDAAEVPERAAHYAQRAGDVAMRTLAFDRAAALYRMALERGGGDDLGHRLHEKLGEALVHAGSDADAGEALLAASARAEGAHAVKLTARAAELLLAVGRFDAGEQAIARALAAVGESLPATAFGSLLQGIPHFILMRLGGFRFRERDAATVTPERLLRLDVLASATYGLMNANFMRGIGPMMRFARMALKTGEPRRAALALIHGATTLEGPTRPAKIDELLDRAEAIADRLSDANLRALALRMRATSHFMYGDLPAARRLCESADALISQQCAGMGIDLRFVRLVAAETDVHLGNLERGRRIAEAELRAAVERRDPVAERGICVSALVSLSLAADEPNKARQYLERVSLEDRCANALFAAVATASLAMYLGHSREAVDNWRSRWAQIKREGLLMPPMFRVIVVRSFATALLDRPEGRADVREAARLIRSIRGYRFPAAIAAWSCLRAYLAVREGRTDRAAALLLEAARNFDDASLSLDAAACRYRYGQIAGGEEGSAQMAAAEQALSAVGIACPERWVGMKLPAVATHQLRAG